MNTIIRTIIGAAAGIMILAAASCSKDTTIRYNNATMGNIVDGRFVSDQGNTFNIVEQNYPGKLDTMQRAFILCDILNSTEGATDEYDVRLNYITKVLTKNPVILSEISATEKFAEDPVLLSDLWISGGYINAIVTFPVKKIGTKQHVINFIYNDVEQKDSTYTFRFSHDAGGEILKEDNSSNQDMVLANAYVSFPISSLIKENTSKIEIKWLSYKIMNQGIISASTEEYSVSRIYEKGAVEQVPYSAKPTSTLTSVE